MFFAVARVNGLFKAIFIKIFMVLKYSNCGGTMQDLLAFAETEDLKVGDHEIGWTVFDEFGFAHGGTEKKRS